MEVTLNETGHRPHNGVNGSDPVRPTGQQDSPAAIEAATMVAKAGLNVRQRSKQQENSPGPDAKKKPQEVSREGIPADIVSQALTVVSTQTNCRPELVLSISASAVSQKIKSLTG